jgi:hypothetical protein
MDKVRKKFQSITAAVRKGSMEYFKRQRHFMVPQQPECNLRRVILQTTGD